MRIVMLGLLMLLLTASQAAFADPAPPNARAAPHRPVIADPEWDRRPTGEDMARYYPAAAERANVSGRATISCNIAVSGNLENCTILSEQPSGYGFGQAAIGLSSTFHMRPQTRDWVPVGGAQLRVPILFMMNSLNDPRYAGMVSYAVPLQRVASQQEAAAAYPSTAHGAGRALVDCVVMPEGQLVGCRALEEAPVGQGFGRAAVQLAQSAYRVPEQPEHLGAGAHVRLMIPLTPGGAEPAADWWCAPACGERGTAER